MPATWDQVDAKRSSGMFIEGLAPQKDGKIKWKMKTSGIFKPKRYSVEMSSASMENIFDDFERGLDRIKEVITEARVRDVKKVRFNSALGPIVRFNLVEACAFMLNHNARHFEQIYRTKPSIDI